MPTRASRAPPLSFTLPSLDAQLRIAPRARQIKVDSKQVDPEPDKRPQYPPPPNPEKDKDGKEVSQEDKDLQEKLDLAVERLEDASMEVRRLALELLRKEIRESTRCVAGHAQRPLA